MLACTAETASGDLDWIEDDHVELEDEFSSISVGEIVFLHVRCTSGFPQDAMGSVIGMADAFGASTASIKYDAFGNVTGSSGSAASIPSSVGTDFRYQGMQLDQATGLYFVRARTYDATKGRFLSRDPYAGGRMRPETQHPYSFAFNSPTTARDPSGLFGLSEISVGLMVSSSLNATTSGWRNARPGDAYHKPFGDEKVDASGAERYGPAAYKPPGSFGYGHIVADPDVSGIPGWIADVPPGTKLPQLPAGVRRPFAGTTWGTNSLPAAAYDTDFFYLDGWLKIKNGTVRVGKKADGSLYQYTVGVLSFAYRIDPESYHSEDQNAFWDSVDWLKSGGDTRVPYKYLNSFRGLGLPELGCRDDDPIAVNCLRSGSW